MLSLFIVLPPILLISGRAWEADFVVIYGDPGPWPVIMLIPGRACGAYFVATVIKTLLKPFKNLFKLSGVCSKNIFIFVYDVNQTAIIKIEPNFVSIFWPYPNS